MIGFTQASARNNNKSRTRNLDQGPKTMSLHGENLVENQEDKTSHFINNNDGVTINDGITYNENASYLLVRDGVAILRKHPTNSTSGHDVRIEKLQHILSYLIPVLCSVVLPFSALNIYLLILQNTESRPSYLLYTNLLLSGKHPE